MPAVSFLYQVFHAVERRGLQDGMARQGEDTSPFSTFLGEPVAIYRNWEAYSYNREPPANQAQGIKQRAAAATTFLQRSRAGLMLPTEITQELVTEEYSARGERDRENLRAQGNTLLLPAAAVHTQGDVTKRLVVHAGGPLMSELRLSWLCHGKREEAGAGPHAGRKRQWWMMGGRSYKAEIGRLRQIELLPERGCSSFDLAEEVVETWALARAGPQALVFAVSPSGESTVRQEEEEEEEEEDGGEGASAKSTRRRLPPYMVRPRQMLRFPSSVCGVAGWSPHRAALLTCDLRLYEWSGAEGVLPFHQLNTPTVVTGVATRRGREFEPQVCWGSHAGSVWVGVGGLLLHVDLRAPPSSVRHVEAMGQLPCGERGGVEGAGIGALAAHPGRENVLFASARASLVALDVRCLRGPLEVLPQSETSTLLHPHPLPCPPVGPCDALVLASGQRTSRIHAHVPLPQSGPAAQRRVLDTWHNDTLWLDPPSSTALPAHHTLTCLNVDCRTQRAQPVWLAGLGLAVAKTKTKGKEAAVLHLSSLGDVYIQRLGTRHHTDEEEGGGPRGHEPPDPLPAVPRSALPCGLSLHAPSPSPPVAPLLPSTAIPQPRDASTLRTHLLVPVTPSSFLPPPPTPAPAHAPPSRVLTAPMRSAVSGLLSDGPRTLAQLHGHLSSLPSASARTQTPPPLHALLRLLRGEQALRSTLCGDGATTTTGVVGPSAAARRQGRVHVTVEGEEKEGGGCRCLLPPASSPQAQTLEPCDAPGCVVPHSILFWRAPVSMEEGGLMLRRRAASKQGSRRGGGGEPSAFSGLDADTIEWLKGRWKDNEEEEEEEDQGGS